MEYLHIDYSQIAKNEKNKAQAEKSLRKFTFIPD